MHRGASLYFEFENFWREVTSREADTLLSPGLEPWEIDPRKIRAESISNPLHGCNSEKAQHSDTPVLQHAGVGVDFADSSQNGLLSRRDLRTQPGVLTPGDDFENRPAPKWAVDPVPHVRRG